MVCFAGCACLLFQGVMWCQSDTSSVQDRSKRAHSVQFTCLVGSAASSFISVRCTVAKCHHSVLSVQFMNSSYPDASNKQLVAITFLICLTLKKHHMCMILKKICSTLKSLWIRN